MSGFSGGISRQSAAAGQESVPHAINGRAENGKEEQETENSENNIDGNREEKQDGT